MKPNELRVGNYLNAELAYNSDTITYFKNSKVQEIGQVYVKLQDRLIPYEYLTPIPLTEEWLLKFGFTSCDSKIKGKGQKLTIQISNLESLDYEDGEFFISDVSDNRVFSFWYKIEYVHQLQNIVFVLTGEELTIKETV